MPSDAPHCWNCGADYPVGARFCPHCGSALKGDAAASGGPALTDETRKVVTVLFVDLVGSTALTEQLDPEDARTVVGQFYQVVQDIVERFGGRVANLLGDAVLAIFGLPTAHENDPERAVRAALAIREAMPDLNTRLRAAHNLSLNIRAGINTGEVVAASGSTFDRDFLISDAVTTAARLQQTVSPGIVVVGDRAYRLTQTTIEYRPLPPLEVKGKTAALMVWEAVAARRDAIDETRVASPFVGRDVELSIIRGLFGRCRSEGVVHMVTILGQPGVGKSRLAREFLAEARAGEPSPVILRGRSTAFGEQIGYRALIDILRGQAGLMDTDSTDVVRVKVADWLARAVPSQASLLDELLLTFGSADGHAGDPRETQRRLIDAWKTLLSRLADARPVIAVFEDLHWADDGVFDLIDAVIGNPEPAAIFVACVARPELLQRRAGWGVGWRNTLVIDVKPLGPREASQIVAAIGGQHLDAATQQTIVQRADGNPLFTEELVRMLLDNGGDRGATRVTIPDTVQAVLTARVDQLPPAERRALQAAAVVGRSFWPGAVVSLTGASTQDTTAAIEDLTVREFVVRRPTSTIADEREFAFRHILARDVAYSLLPRSQRQRAHAQAARWLEDQVGERAEDAMEILAEHWRLAGDDARAAAYLERAAQKARRLYANANALHLFDQALEAARRAGLPAEAVARILLERGAVHQHLGEYAKALDDFETGLTQASQARSDALEATLENRVGLILHRTLKLDEAEAHFRRAAERARQISAHQTLGLSLIDLATVAWDRGTMSPFDPTLVEGIALLEQHADSKPDKSSLARALNLLCMAYYGAGDNAGALAAGNRALSIAREAGDKSREATSLSYLAVVHTWAGRPREAVRHAYESLNLARTIGDRRRIAYAVVFIAQASYEAGEWGTGIPLLEQHFGETHQYAAIEAPFVFLSLGFMRYEVGDYARARALLAQGRSTPQPNPAWSKGTIIMDLMIARLDADANAMQQAVDALDRHPLPRFTPLDLSIMGLHGDALATLGRADALRRLIDVYRPGVERYGSPSFSADLATLDALVAMHEGRRDAAGTHLDEAVRLSRTAGSIPTLRRALELGASRLRREDHHAELRALLERIAVGLPDDLRELFLASPRVVPYLGHLPPV